MTADMCEKSTMDVEEAIKEITNGEARSEMSLKDAHNSRTQARFAKKVLLSLTKPSSRLVVKSENLRMKNRSRLRSLLRRLVRLHNWEEASGVLSVLLKGTVSEKSPHNNRTKYLVAMELLKHIKGDTINSTKMQHVFEIWMKKIGSMKDWPIKDKFVVQLEFILFCLGQGNLEGAHQAAICLMQEREFGSDPVSNMVVGLTFCQLWYSTVPNELKLRDPNKSHSPEQSETSGMKSDIPSENSEGHDAVDFHKAASSFQADSPFQVDSDTSVGNDKHIVRDVDVDQDRGVSIEVDHNLPRETNYQDYQSQGFYMDPSEDTGQEESLSNRFDNMQYGSIFNCHGLDSWLLPLRVPHPNENLEDFIYLHRRTLNDYYKGAIKHLRVALYSTPPVYEALIPLVQILLLGDHVAEALNELERFGHNSQTALPLRVKASLLERFDSANSVGLSTCFEDMLKKDPTCGYSLAKLVIMHQNGMYGPQQLLEMIALHLDASYAECNTWNEFACCFLKLCRCEEDRVSVCLNGKEGVMKQDSSICFNRIPKVFTDGILGKAWRLRCRWWLTRHFSRNILTSEIAAGDLPLIAYKAASASHIYGQEFEYVVKACTFVKDKDRDLFLLLQTHMQNSFGFYSKFVKK